MKEFTPTWLYIKQHNVTSPKYFGKTVRDNVENYKEKISKSNKGKHHSRVAKDKIAAGNKGKIRIPETIRKMSEATKMLLEKHVLYVMSLV